LQIAQQFVDRDVQAHVGAPGNDVRDDRRRRYGENKKNYKGLQKRKTAFRLTRTLTVKDGGTTESEPMVVFEMALTAI
jgi:hypothetical protein